jgi:small-conductance mechanosensitive channel
MPSDASMPDVAARVKLLYAILEPFAKGCVAAAALCYALGLLVKNLYLSQWATFSANLIQVEYVMSGALFILVVLMGLAVWSCSLGMIRRAKRTRNRDITEGYSRVTRRARLKMAGVVLGGGLGVAVFLGFIYDIDVSRMAGHARAADYIDYVLGLAVTLIAFPGLVFLAWKPIGDMWHDFSTGQNFVPGEAAMRFFFRSALLLAVVLLYVHVIYPRVSPVYGGGKLTPIQLRVTDDGSKVLHGMGFKPTDSEGHMFDAKLIFEDGTYFVLASPVPGERNAVRIHRDKVTSIVTHGAQASRDWL